FLTIARRKPGGRIAAATVAALDRVRDEGAVAAVSLLTWSQAGRELVRLRRQQRRLRGELDATLRRLGQAVYSGRETDGAEPERIIRLEEDAVVLLDQRRLPAEESELVCRSAAEVAEAIRTLAIRGAPAIGIAAAYGYALAAARGEDLDEAAAVLGAARPTA